MLVNSIFKVKQCEIPELLCLVRAISGTAGKGFPSFFPASRFVPSLPPFRPLSLPLLSPSSVPPLLHVSPPPLPLSFFLAVLLSLRPGTWYGPRGTLLAEVLLVLKYKS